MTENDPTPAAGPMDEEALSETLGGCLTLVMYAAALSLPACALYIMVRTPDYLEFLHGRQLYEFPPLTQLFLSAGGRVALVVIGAAFFAAFAIAWKRRKLQAAAILAPVIFALTLALASAWYAAMQPLLEDQRHSRAACTFPTWVGQASRLPRVCRAGLPRACRGDLSRAPDAAA